MEINSSKSSVFPIDIDFETEIKHSSILNIRHELDSRDDASLSRYSTKIFSDNIPTRVNERANINIIYMDQSSDTYHAFFVYEDLFSRYVVLKPLRNVPNNVSEIVEKLIDIFSLIGAPKILQCSSGRNFAERIVRRLRKIIPTLEIVHGYSLKETRNCRDFKTLLEIWRDENPLRSWYEGLHFIQILENTSNFSTIKNGKPKNSPSKIFFEQNINDELVRFFVKRDFISIINEVWTEEEWLGKTVKYHFHDNCIKKEFDAKPEIKNSNKYNNTDNTNLINSSKINNYEEAFKLYFESNKSSIPFLGSQNNHINGNNKRTNVKSFNVISSAKNKLLPKTEKSLTDIEIRDLSQMDYYSCYLCDKIFITEVYLNTHMKNHQTTLNNKDEDSNNASSKKNLIQPEDNSEKITNRPLKSPVGNVENKNDDDTQNDTTAGKIKPKISLKRTRNKKPNKEVSFECVYCSKKFYFYSALERHIRIHTNERPYICKVCNKGFKQLGHLSQHGMSHIDYRSYQCPTCDEIFQSLQTLNSHIKIHKDGQPYTLKIPYRLYECDICKNVFVSKGVLERHFYTHTNERHYSCDICGKKFKQAGHVKTHLLSHTGEKKFQCKVCLKRFTCVSSLKKHLLLHIGYKPFQCNICGMRFFENRNLKGHMLTHTNEKPYVCKICGKQYTLAETLKRHISSIHGRGRVYQCEICAKMFKQLAHLNVHKRIHNDERPYHCQICSKNFKYKNILKSHLTTHANLKPFKCDICKTTFTKKSNLRIHIASNHLSEHPYSCNICGQTFKQSTHLNGHIITHSNDWPYQCEICDKKCNRIDNLKKHMKLHQRHNKSVTCEYYD